MNVVEIKKQLFKPATIFETGCAEPTELLGESWLGAVMWGKPGEKTPENYDPLFTLFLANVEHVPEVLRGIVLITAYIEIDAIEDMTSDDIAAGFKIQMYTSLDGLTKINNRSTLNGALPMKPSVITNDVPSMMDDVAFSPEVQRALTSLEQQSNFDYEEVIAENDPMAQQHKIGGYPSFIQNGVSFGDDYVFVFQISSDDNTDFFIGDDGNLYFFYNCKTNDWAVACDWY